VEGTTVKRPSAAGVAAGRRVRADLRARRLHRGGAGRHRRTWPDGVEMMRAIKRTLDLGGIFNPGKVAA
jgi:FAD/FMN-containing dehydrogenase